MNLLRYVLVAATLSCLGLLLYMRTTSYHPDNTDLLLWWMFLIGLVLNLIYLVCRLLLEKKKSDLAETMDADNGTISDQLYTMSASRFNQARCDEYHIILS